MKHFLRQPETLVSHKLDGIRNPKLIQLTLFPQCSGSQSVVLRLTGSAPSENSLDVQMFLYRDKSRAYDTILKISSCNKTYIYQCF